MGYFWNDGTVFVSNLSSKYNVANDNENDLCWNHFIKLCRKCIWMDFHVNAFAIGRNLFFQHSIMLFHVSTEDGIFIAQFLKGFDRFFRSEIITADDIERSFLIRESS